jgi:hypothetical protein
VSPQVTAITILMPARVIVPRGGGSMIVVVLVFTPANPKRGKHCGDETHATTQTTKAPTCGKHLAPHNE